MIESSGTIHLGQLVFVTERWGEEAVERCLASLEPDDAHLLRSITAAGVYDLAPMMRFRRAVGRLYGTGELSLCHEIGVFSAEWDLNAFHKAVLRVRRPSFLIERASSLWRRYHSSGRFEVETPTETSCVGRLFDFPLDDRAFCIGLEGWISRAFGLSGARFMKVNQSNCATAGSGCCEFRVHWQ
jgi:hypothetical protein